MNFSSKNLCYDNTVKLNESNNIFASDSVRRGFLAVGTACIFSFAASGYSYATPCGAGSDLTIGGSCSIGIGWLGGYFTVDPEGSVNSTSSAVVVGGTAGTLTNNGSLISSDVSHGAVYVDGGSVTAIINSAGATISNDSQSAIDNSAGVIGSIVNAGTLSAPKYVILNEQGEIESIVNTETGSIIGTADRGQGIANNGIVGTITNDGLIESINATPNSFPGSPEPSPTGIINIGSAQSITNNGTIRAGGSANGVGIVNSAQSVSATWATIETLTNTGLITVDSYAPGNTSNPPYSVGIENTYGYIDTLDNQGDIVAAGYDGAAAYGVENYGSITQMQNDGNIWATSEAGVAYGILNRGAGSVRPVATIGEFINTGEIASSYYGIYNLGAINVVNNSGTISGTVAGIYSTGINSLIGSIDNSGSILGGDVAIDASANNGALTITNSGTISGATSLNIGSNSVVLIAEGGSEIAGDIAIDGGSLTVSVADTFTFASAITGSGSLVKDDLGTLILTGENSFTGGTTISAGTLQIGDGGTTGSVTGNIVNNAALVFNRTGTYDFPGTISGSGMVKILHGVVNFNQADAYSGTIVVTDADFIMGEGSVSATSLNIGAGGKIGGTGTIGGLVLESGGTVAPGYSPGTLTVAGNVTFEAGSVYAVDVTSGGEHDLITASRTATIEGGTVEVLGSQTGYTPGVTYTILTAQGGVTGTFSDVIANYAFLDPSLSYDANNVMLTLMRNAALFADAAVTPNQKATAVATEALGRGNEVYDTVVELTEVEASEAFDALSGEVHASVRTAMVDDSRFVRDAAVERVRAAFAAVGATSTPVLAYAADGSGRTISASADTHGLAIWTSAYGAWGDVDGNGNAAAMAHNVAGFTVGVDAELIDDWRFGLYGGYGHSTYDVDERHSAGDAANYSVGLYGGTQMKQIGLRLGAAYTWSDVETGRAVNYTGFSDTLAADYKAATAQLFADLGYRIDTPVASFEPFAGLAYVNLHTDAFTETGGDAALSSAASTTDFGISSLGVRASRAFTAHSIELTATGAAGWRHGWGDVSPDASMSFSDTNAFAIEGLPIARDTGFVEAGISTSLSDRATLAVSYTGQYGSRAQSQGVRGNLNIKF